jgi:hypothetical protein
MKNDLLIGNVHLKMIGIILEMIIKILIKYALGVKKAVNGNLFVEVVYCLVKIGIKT